MANVKIALSYLLGQVEGKTQNQELNTENWTAERCKSNFSKFKVKLTLACK